MGVGFDASYVRRAVSGLRHRLDDLSSRAAALLGGDLINLASAPQVAEAGPVRYCSPRRMMPLISTHEGRVQHVLNDRAGNICLSLCGGVVREAGATAALL